MLQTKILLKHGLWVQNTNNDQILNTTLYYISLSQISFHCSGPLQFDISELCGDIMEQFPCKGTFITKEISSLVEPQFSSSLDLRICLASLDFNFPPSAKKFGAKKDEKLGLPPYF